MFQVSCSKNHIFRGSSSRSGKFCEQQSLQEVAVAKSVLGCCSQIQTLRGHSLFCVEWGPRESARIVVLWACRALDWFPFLKFLAKRQCRAHCASTARRLLGVPGLANLGEQVLRCICSLLLARAGQQPASFCRSRLQ